MLTPRWPLLPGPDDARLVELYGLDDRLTCVAIDPDGAWVVTGATGGQVRLWDPRTGAHLRSFDVGGDVVAVAAAPDGGLVAAVDRGGVHVWQAPGGGLRHRFGSAAELFGCAISETNRWLVAWGVTSFWRWDLTADDVAGSVCEVTTSEPWWVPPDARTVVSVDGRLLAAPDKGNLVHVWDIGTLEQVAEFDLGEPAIQARLAFASGGRSLIVTVLGRSRILAVADGTLEDEVTVVSSPVDFPGDLLLELDAVDLRVFTRQGRELLNVPGRHRTIAGFAATADGRLLVCAHHDGVAVVWDGDMLRRFLQEDRSDRVYQCVPVSGGEWFLTTHRDRTVVRSMNDASPQHTLSEGHLHRVDVAPDVSWVAVASYRELAVVETGTWREVARRPGKFADLCRITPDGRTVIGMSGDAVTSWTRGEPGVYGMPLVENKPSVGALVAPDGSWAAFAVAAGVRLFPLPLRFAGTVADDATAIRVGAVRRGRPRVAPPGEQLQSITCTTDGRLLLAAGHSGALHTWHTAAFRTKPVSVQAHRGAFTIVVDPAGRWVCTLGLDQRWCFFATRNLRYGSPPRSVTETTWTALAAAASPDGTRIATVDRDGVLSVWAVPEGRDEPPVQLATLTIRALPDTLIWTGDGLFTAGRYGAELFRIDDQ